jgi:hypothetical protein
MTDDPRASELLQRWERLIQSRARLKTSDEELRRDLEIEGQWAVYASAMISSLLFSCEDATAFLHGIDGAMRRRYRSEQRHWSRRVPLSRWDEEHQAKIARARVQAAEISAEDDL